MVVKENYWRERVRKKLKIRREQIREFFGIQPINEWLERRRREWDEHAMRIACPEIC